MGCLIHILIGELRVPGNKVLDVIVSKTRLLTIHVKWNKRLRDLFKSIDIPIDDICTAEVNFAFQGYLIDFFNIIYQISLNFQIIDISMQTHVRFPVPLENYPTCIIVCYNRQIFKQYPSYNLDYFHYQFRIPYYAIDIFLLERFDGTKPMLPVSIGKRTISRKKGVKKNVKNPDAPPDPTLKKRRRKVKN